MNCDNFKDKLYENFGQIELSDEELEHLEECAACREIYEELSVLDGALVDPAPEMMPTEFAIMQERLGERITEYRNRAFGWYDRIMRYGVSVAAVVIVFAISLVSTYKTDSTNELNNITIIEYSDYTGSFISSDDIELDGEYYDLVADEYHSSYGSNSAEPIIGDIDEDEYQYLLDNIEVGDLL